MSALSLLSGVKRKSGLRAVTSVVDLGCVNVRARKARRIVFSIVLSRQPSPALLFFKLIEVETKFPFANSISAFSRGQDPQQSFGLSRVTVWRLFVRGGRRSHLKSPCGVSLPGLLL